MCRRMPIDTGKQLCRQSGVRSVWTVRCQLCVVLYFQVDKVTRLASGEKSELGKLEDLMEMAQAGC